MTGVSTHNAIIKYCGEVISNFINPDETIKGIQIGEHEIEIVNFAEKSTIFLTRDINYLNRIQVILKLYENAKIN